MLFVLHQMAMKKDAEDKQQRILADASRQIVVNESCAPVIWVLGGPGCGKGTQCAKIVERYQFQHFSTGDLLRAEVASGSPKGKELQEIMKTGKLVSNDDVLHCLQGAMIKVLNNASGFLIDGYPREKSQGAAFEKVVAPVDLILFFDCTDETMIKRIMHRAALSAEVRADDNEATIKTRLETFRANTNLILEQYPNKTKIINAERSADEIFADVVAAIEPVIASKKVKVAATA